MRTSVTRSVLMKMDWFVMGVPMYAVTLDSASTLSVVLQKNVACGLLHQINLAGLQPRQQLCGVQHSCSRGLQSGEIDLVQQTTGNILLEDYESVRALPNVTVHTWVRPSPTSPSSSAAERVTDVRIRQALLYGIDRQTILG